MRAVISDCGLYRYLLERWSYTGPPTPVFAFFGVNPSTADAECDDATVRKWRGFVKRWGGNRFLVGNAFAYRSTDVQALALVQDPMGPDMLHHLDRIIAEADVLVPCWGSRMKLPTSLRPQLAQVAGRLRRSGKPVKVFGLTKSGDPLHPLMLGYDTPLVDWPGT